MIGRKQAQQNYLGNFNLIDVPPFRLAVDTLRPGATGRQAAELLDHRISREVANHWLAGRRHAEPWALHELARKIRAQASPQLELAAELERIKKRPGKQAGARNLAIWLARR